MLPNPDLPHRRADPHVVVQPAGPLSRRLPVYVCWHFRSINFKTFLPDQPRSDVVVYTVTLFAIAQKFNLQPETLFWSIRICCAMIPTC